MTRYEESHFYFIRAVPCVGNDGRLFTELVQESG